MGKAEQNELWHGKWSNVPAASYVDTDGALRATSGDRTDFWQATHYGFRRDDGHALLRSVEGEFTATLRFTGKYETLYDQAGLMLRAGPENWIKFGIEHTDGLPHLSVVATREGLSDWSAQPVELEGPVVLRATLLGDAVLLQSSNDAGQSWSMVRLSPDPSDDTARGLGVGPYLCSPERAGFEARFLAFEVAEPKVRALHE